MSIEKRAALLRKKRRIIFYFGSILYTNIYTKVELISQGIFIELWLS